MSAFDDTSPPPFAARWAGRVAVFSVVLLVTSLILHRAFQMPTAVMLNLAAVAFAGAVLALVLAAAAVWSIWWRGTPGTAHVVVASVMALALLAWPLSALPQAMALPPINDVTTHPEQPPRFVEIAKKRPRTANPVAYPGAEFAKLQTVAYPDLRPLVVRRSAAETFDVAAQAIRRLNMEIVREDPPGGTERQPGAIEAIDRTLVLGFRDDVVVRVYGSKRAARIDVRSASRYGRHDLGRNAERVRRVLKEIVARLEATVTAAAPEPEPEKAKPAVAKKPKAKRRSKRRRRARSRKSRRRSRPPPSPYFFP